MNTDHIAARLRLAELDAPRRDNLPSTIDSNTGDYTSFSEDDMLEDLINQANMHTIIEEPTKPILLPMAQFDEKTSEVTITPSSSLPGITINATTVNIYYQK